MLRLHGPPLSWEVLLKLGSYYRKLGKRSVTDFPIVLYYTPYGLHHSSGLSTLSCKLIVLSG
jgi:hypothetical protein